MFYSNNLVSMNKENVSIVISVFALLISLFVALYDINENEQTKIEKISIFTSRSTADYPSKIIPVPFYNEQTSTIEQTAVIPVYFECTIINEGEKPINIMDCSIQDMSSPTIEYAYMNMGFLDSSGEPLSFPINLQSKHGKKLLMKVGLRMNSTVFNDIDVEKLQTENTTIRDITHHCAEKGYDIYGNAATYTDFGDGTYYLSVFPELYQVFIISFNTSNDNSFYDTFSWYNNPQ